MSDFDISGSDSEPVSDINPEEMAKLMADLGDVDDVFKSSEKPPAKIKPTAEKEKTRDEGQRVTFDKKQPEEDDDWDADDLLQSDDDIPKMKTQKSKSPGKHIKSGSPESKITQSDGKDRRNLTKTKLMADLFTGNSEDKIEMPAKSRSELSSASDIGSGKKDKSKLMAELFGSNDAATEKSSHTRQNIKKSKDEVTFDDDDDDLFSGFGESKRKAKAVSDSPKGKGFLDSLLAKSNASDDKQTDKKNTSEFILDEKYKNMSKAKKKDQESFGDYMPSAGKPDSPRRRTPQKAPASDPFDIFGDKEPRRPNARSAARRKTFESDDGIKGNMQCKKGPSRQLEKEKGTKNESDLNKGDADSSFKQLQSESQRRDVGGGNKSDWLFDGLESETHQMKKVETAFKSAELKDDSIPRISPSVSKSPNWLGNLLSTDTKHSSEFKQVASVSNIPAGISTPSDQKLRESLHSRSEDNGDGHPSKAQSYSSSAPVMQTQSDTDGMQLQLLKEQQEAQVQVAAQIKAQNEQNSQLTTQIDHQQMAVEIIKQQQATMKRYQEAVLNMGQMTLPVAPVINMNSTGDDDHLKELMVKLRSAEIEVARLQAELELIHNQHSKEISILENANVRRMNIEKEVWEQTEKHLREQRDSVVNELQSKLSTLQLEKDSLVAAYEVQLGHVKSEWSQALERTKELYMGIMEKMKEEHNAALQRITDLKELELKAAVSATGHAREMEVVMNQLESNASNLSEISAVINSKQDSALEMMQRALKIKEKQLQDFEAQLAATQAENESERGRLNALIHRLENTLVQQGSEVEKERWSFAQKQMKIEIERQAIAEERRHLQFSVETERQNLAKTREMLIEEHRGMLQDVAKQKQEIEAQQAQLKKKNLNELYSTNIIPATNNFSLNQGNLDAESTFLNNEHRRLKEKLAAIQRREQEVRENEDRSEELSFQLEQEKVRMELEREVVLQEKKSASRKVEEAEAIQQELQAMRQAQQARVSQIKSQTAALHANQERMEKERQRLDLAKKDVMHSVQLGLCPSCQSKRGNEIIVDLVSKYSATSRVPGDGGEGHTNNKMEKHNSISLAPSSVLARLTAAREHENFEREKRLQQISAIESS
ncbi:fas-binding factor 1 homolog [Penaeus chinensis]|uniref:fas-binding factor 1 homolog n=1 Tax=Penaeus chinensis TaxID=139456 RepID=UPI001FB6B380|nr:fas-binding factor 1 homolog [Penaeus chinensis]